MLRLRERYSRWGKEKLKVLLAREGILTSASTVGRILAHLKAKGRLTEPRRPHGIRSRRQVTRCDEYSPSRRRIAPTSPGPLACSTSRSRRSLYSAVNRRRFGFASTAGSGAQAAATAGGSPVALRAPPLLPQTPSQAWIPFVSTSPPSSVNSKEVGVGSYVGTEGIQDAIVSGVTRKVQAV